jgi:hypothetical protein
MYQKEIKTMTYYVNPEMLGPNGTEEAARLMVKILTERGYDVAFGEVLGQEKDVVTDKDWHEALSLIPDEFYTDANE